MAGSPKMRTSGLWFEVWKGMISIAKTLDAETASRIAAAQTQAVAILPAAKGIREPVMGKSPVNIME